MTDHPHKDEAGLAACPFCGGRPTVRQAMGETWVICTSCNSTADSKTRPERAFEIWNTRTPPVPDGTGMLEEGVGLLRRVQRIYGDMENGSGFKPTELRKIDRFLSRLEAERKGEG